MITPGVIEALPARRCELCAKRAECRPYGPHGEWVCFPCAMRDEAAARRGFDRVHDGADHPLGSTQ